jgi:hypothetical protein
METSYTGETGPVGYTKTRSIKLSFQQKMSHIISSSGAKVIAILVEGVHVVKVSRIPEKHRNNPSN